MAAKKKKSVIYLYILIIFSAVLVAFTYFKGRQLSNKSYNPIKPDVSVGENRPRVFIGETKVDVEVARSANEISRGLSGREKLSENEGMLFVFENKTQPAFWMIDMNFDLDIIWIADGEIVYIHENVSAPAPGTPDSQLPRYSPPNLINYVLEVNAGFSERNGIEVGESIDFSSIN
jgi:hypothetical protein